jgi:hypothetical protein
MEAIRQLLLTSRRICVNALHRCRHLAPSFETCFQD